MQVTAYIGGLGVVDRGRDLANTDAGLDGVVVGAEAADGRAVHTYHVSVKTNILDDVSTIL